MTSPHTRSIHRLGTAAIIALGALAGCVQHPALFTAVTMTARDVTYACTGRQLTRLGYFVTGPDSTGVMIGDRASGQHGLGKVGHVDHDRILATVAKADTVPLRLRLLATTERINTFLDRQQIQTVKTSDTVSADALIVMHACAGSYR